MAWSCLKLHLLYPLVNYHRFDQILQIIRHNFGHGSVHFLQIIWVRNSVPDYIQTASFSGLNNYLL